MTASSHSSHRSIINIQHQTIPHLSSWTRRDFLTGLRTIGATTLLLSVGNGLVACHPRSRELKLMSSTQLLPEIGELWSPDLKFATTNTQSSGSVSIIDVATQQKIATLEGPDVYTNFSPLRRPWSANNQYLLLVEVQSEGKPDLHLDMYNTHTGKKIYTGTIGSKKSMSYAWSPDNTRIALTGKDTVTLWHGTTGKPLSETALNIPSLNIEVLSWSPDSKLLALATVEGSDTDNKKLSIRIWDCQTCTITTTFNIPTTTNSTSSFVTLSWSPQGSIIAALLNDQKVWLIRPFKKAEISALDQTFSPSTFSMDWSLDDSYLAIPNAGTAEIWDITRRELAYSISLSHPDSFLAWSYSNKNIITSVEGSTMRTWSLP